MGAACRDGTYMVLFVAGVPDVATPPEVPHLLLLGPLGVVRIGLLGVHCEGAGAGSSAAYPSSVIAVMISSRCFISMSVRVTLVVVASNSASMFSTSSLNAGGVIIFSFPF